MAAGQVLGWLKKRTSVASMILFRQNPTKYLCSSVAVKRLPVKEWQMVPSQQEVSALMEKFEDPEGLINKLLARRPIAGKQSEYLSRKGSVWNFKLTMNFPVTINVCGCGRTPVQAKLSAYLQACSMLQDLCLVKPCPGEVVNCYEAILQLGYSAASQKKLFSKKDFIYKMVQLNEGEIWSCNVTSNMMRAIGYGLSREEAKENASSSLLLKLKARSLVRLHNDGQVSLASPFRLCLPANSWTDESQADFFFHVDASKEGFGAYLINKDQSDVVRWISQKWPPRILDHLCHHTCFLEFYALYSVVFTWKKKFMNSHVLAHSDSQTVCQFINHGIDIRPNNSLLFFKPYKSLIETCIKYNITLKAKFVARDYNIEADLLSRQRLCNFFCNMEDKLENPSFISKKAKQLTFLKPFVYEQLRCEEACESS